MISPLDAGSQMMLADLARINERAARANQQISSGVRVSTASDAPADIADILDFQAGIERSRQIQTNLARAAAEVNTADSAIQSGVKLLDRARALATMGATTSYTPAQRQVMADEVQGILQSMVALANTKVDGRFIFGGDDDTAAPCGYDDTLLATNPVVAATSLTSTRLIERADGTRFPASRNARGIFGATADDGVFGALNDLRLALRSGTSDDVAAIMDSLHAASDQLNSTLTFYGTASNNVQNGVDAASRQETQLKAELSQVRDTDIPEAALELQQATLNQQAALAAFAQRPKNSLFDYLG